ncbi:TylF/MycF/NovP-related O-methyltransferase [Sphaerisporangium viridialbum]|uniref:TylF/MycF/NovP-related O-methyltransferase n=1 Tax=Sphaerisporangium viridialbum TaxID=46189 RepID=UPI003C74C604
MTTDDGAGTSLYLDLLKRCLLNLIYTDPPIATPWQARDVFDLQARLEGKDWPSIAHTMIGMSRLDNLQLLIERILAEGIPGDLMEAGIARGGAAVFMRGALKAYSVTDRNVWAADSFEGFPRTGDEAGHPSPLLGVLSELTEQVDDPASTAYARFLAGTSLAEVQQTFAKYGLLDEQVRFLAGWFSHTLPRAPIDRLALLRLDADLYGSTYDALRLLYPKVVPGGFVIVDDYHAIEECREAVQDYLKSITEDITLERVDYSAAYWRKSHDQRGLRASAGPR